MKHFLWTLLVVTAACNGVLGTREVVYEPGVAPPTGQDSGTPSQVDAGQDSALQMDAAPLCEGVDFATNAKHCGRCGHDCLGGLCTAGKCEAKLLASIPGARGMALVGEDLFVASYTGNTLHRVTKAGGTPATLGPCTSCLAVAANTQSVFAGGFSFDPQPLMCPPTGCSSPPNTRGEGGYVRSIVLFGTDIVYASEDGIRRTTASGTTTTIVAPSRPWKVAVDGTYVYYTSSANVFQRAPLTGGTSEVVGDAPGSSVLGGARVVENRVYWTSGSADAAGPGTVASIGTNLAGAIVYAPGMSGVGASSITADGAYVYWTTLGPGLGTTAGAGALHRCPLAGCTQPETLLSGLSAPDDVVLDDVSIFVSHDTGVLRLAKP